MKTIEEPKVKKEQDILVKPSLNRIETCQFVLNSTGMIVSCDQDSADKIGCPYQKLEGRHLREVLFTLNPEWDQRLPHDLLEDESTLFLPFSFEEKTSPKGIQLHRKRFQENLFVTLSPTLAPHNEMREASLHDFPRDEETFAQMAYRLQSTENQLQSYLQNFPGVFFSQRPDFSFIKISDGFTNTTGYQANAFRHNGSRFIEMLYEKDRNFFLKEVEKGTYSKTTFNFSYRIRHASDNSIRYIMDVRTPTFSPSGLLLGYEGVWLDITRQSIAENHLTSTAWKENLATLTGGLIHDFSNVMAGIYSLSELYHENLSPDDSMYLGIGQIKKSSQQAQKLVRRIIDLNREVSSQRNYHNLEYLIKDQMDLLPVILPKQCPIHTHFTERELPVYLDDVAFRQLLLNLCINARDAIGPDGELSISTQRINCGEPAFVDAYKGPWIADRDGIEIQFTDNGEGIDPSFIERIFDPFFTTKEVTKGSGFGLYNARLFVEENRGRMSVRSVKGEGTTFYIFLPIADFTEADEEREQNPEPANEFSRRASAIIFGKHDPDNSQIVQILRDREWETITFSQEDRLNHFLKETSLLPDILIAISIGKSSDLEHLIDEMGIHFPKIKKVIQIRGENPDSVSNTLCNKVERIFDESTSEPEIVKELITLVT